MVQAGERTGNAPLLPPFFAAATLRVPCGRDRCAPPSCNLIRAVDPEVSIRGLQSRTVDAASTQLFTAVARRITAAPAIDQTPGLSPWTSQDQIGFSTGSRSRRSEASKARTLTSPRMRKR